jgi:hypothetical protein
MDYRAYISRGKQELEVFGEVWDDGSGYWDDHEFVVERAPEFAITEAYKNDSREAVDLKSLTSNEILCILDMFTQDYWDQIL